MKMELIQPFINAADAVLSETLACPVTVSDITMEEEAYRRHATAALIEISGDIEGHVIFDVDTATALKVASGLAGTEVNQTRRFCVKPSPNLPIWSLAMPSPLSTTRDFASKSIPRSTTRRPPAFAARRRSRLLVMNFASSAGSVFVNISMRYNRRRHADQNAS